MIAQSEIERLRALDCRDVVARDLGMPRQHSARYLYYACPLHHEQHGRSLTVRAEGWRCWGKCQTGGDAIAWVMAYRGVGFEDACRQLGAAEASTPIQRVADAPRVTSPVDAPPLDWQAAAMEVLVKARRMLWSGKGTPARAYLRKRGIGENMIAEAQIGYIPGDYKAWQKMHGLNVPCGIVIPWMIESDLWQLKVRRAAGNIKYQQVAGGSAGGLYWIDKIDLRGAVMIVEGEFDALVVNQVGEIGAVALGSASNTLRDRWIDRLIFARRLYARLDGDTAGVRATERLRAISSRITPVSVPSGYKDCNEFWLADAYAFQKWTGDLAAG
jgi:DNA primase